MMFWFEFYFMKEKNVTQKNIIPSNRESYPNCNNSQNNGNAIFFPSVLRSPY